MPFPLLATIWPCPLHHPRDFIYPLINAFTVYCMRNVCLLPPNCAPAPTVVLSPKSHPKIGKSAPFGTCQSPGKILPPSGGKIIGGRVARKWPENERGEGRRVIPAGASFESMQVAPGFMCAPMQMASVRCHAFPEPISLASCGQKQQLSTGQKGGKSG